jgi:hypothetical protein
LGKIATKKTNNGRINTYLLENIILNTYTKLMLSSFTLSATPFFAGLLLSLAALRALFALRLLHHSVALRPASLLRDSAH